MDNQLGVRARISKLALICGIRHDLPRWFWEQPKWRRIIYRIIYGYIELSLICLVISCMVLLSKVGMSDIGVFTETIGSCLFLTFGMGKAYLINRKRHLVDKMMQRIHVVAGSLHRNSALNDQYLSIHNKRLRFLRIYIDVKTYGLLVAIVLVVFQQYIPGMLHPSPDSRTPMYGWFPLDYTNRLSFTFACFSQWFQYTLIGVRDLYADMTLLLILATTHAQLLFMQELLHDLIRNKKLSSLKFWISQHQEITKILQEFTEIGASVLFATYIYVATFFFFLLVRLTEDKNFVLLQQATIIALTIGNMIHMYIVSAIGDDIAESSVSVAEAVEDEELWDADRNDQKMILQVAVCCTNPAFIVFGDNRKLCLSSFGDIATAMFSYFNTVYQLRQEA